MLSSKPWVEQGIRWTASGSGYKWVNWCRLYKTIRTIQASCCAVGYGIADGINSEMMVLDFADHSGTNLAYRYSNGTANRPTTFYITGIGPY